MSSINVLGEYNFPIKLQFNVGTFHNDFTATDSLGNVIAYTKQKIFKFKEHVIVYTDTNQTDIKFEIKADKWLDFNTSYAFTDKNGMPIGRVLRKGWRSLWKAQYNILDEKEQPDCNITEANPWVKVADGLLSEIPILGIFTGYLFNPTYNVTRPDGTLICQLKKDASFFGRKFTIEQQDILQAGEEERVLLSLMMMVLLERRRG
jgi:hypothetical protein